VRGSHRKQRGRVGCTQRPFIVRTGQRRSQTRPRGLLGRWSVRWERDLSGWARNELSLTDGRAMRRDATCYWPSLQIENLAVVESCAARSPAGTSRIDWRSLWWSGGACDTAGQRHSQTARNRKPKLPHLWHDVDTPMTLRRTSVSSPLRSPHVTASHPCSRLEVCASQ